MIVGSIGGAAGARFQAPSGTVPSSPVRPFSEVLSRTKSEGVWSLVANPALFRELTALQQRVLQSKTIEPRDLLIYQVKASQFGLGIELLSKLAEAVSSSIRKFQNNP